MAMGQWLWGNGYIVGHVMSWCGNGLIGYELIGNGVKRY